MPNILLTEEEADFIHSTFLATHIYLYARDQADSQLKMMPGTRESSLTKEVAECVKMFESKFGQALMQARALEQAALDVPLEYSSETEDDEDED